MESIDALVIGGGVVGLAVARQLATDGREVCVLERHRRVGTETSSRNSGVIHAGIYYPRGTLKASLCVEGRQLLYAFAAEHGVPHERCGKLIVASSDDDCAVIETLLRKGAENGVQSLRCVSSDFIREREPHINAIAGIWSPETGIIDVDALIVSLRHACIDAGVHILTGTPVTGGRMTHNGHVVETPTESILASLVVNAAGLMADEVSAALGGETFRVYPCRGEYAELIPSRRHLVRGLVYPVPEASGHGLGVHFTRTPAGSVCLGPTARYQARKDDYESDRLPIEHFYTSAKRLVPELSLEDLRLGTSGIRPKLHGPDEGFADFMIRFDRRASRLLHLAGIESPGLTSSLAIAKRVSAMVREGAADLQVTQG